MGIMNIRLGETLRVKTPGKISKINIGKVVSISKYTFTVDYGMYREAFKIADLVCPISYLVQRKVNGAWQTIVLMV